MLAWGSDTVGQLGNGTKSPGKDRPVHVKLPAGATATIAAAGCSHSLALTSAGLYGWGLNFYGQLGNGTTNNVTSTPVPIIIERRGPPLGKLVSLFAGCYHTYALFAKGAVLAWGFNGDGQLGNATLTDSDTPVSVALPSGASVKAISAGCNQGYAVTKSGLVLAWGLNAHGELGDGTLTNSDTPVTVRLPAGLTATAVCSPERWPSTPSRWCASHSATYGRAHAGRCAQAHRERGQRDDQDATPPRGPEYALDLAPDHRVAPDRRRADHRPTRRGGACPCPQRSAGGLGRERPRPAGQRHDQ